LPLSPGWNAFTFPLTEAKKFSAVTATYMGQTQLIKNAAVSNWLLNYAMYFQRHWYSLPLSNDDNLFQPGRRYWVWAKKNNITLNFTKPFIIGTNPCAAESGDIITLTGVNFGSSQGDSSITFNGITAGSVQSWSDTRIVCSAPAGLSAGNAAVQVIVSGEASNIYLLSISGSYWLKTWGGASDEYPYYLTKDASNNLYMVGETGSFGAGNGDAFIVKYNSAGTLLWQKTWGGDSWDYASTATVDAAGNLYVAGATCSFTADNSADIFLLKYNSSGVLLWQRTWGGNAWEFPYDLAIDTQGYIYLAGGTDSFTSSSSSSLLLKFNSTGNLVWQRIYGCNLPDSYTAAYQMELDRSNNIYLTGYLQSSGNVKTLLLKYSQAGNLLWQRTWGGSGSERGYGIILDDQDNLYLTGSTTSFGNGSDDIYLLKFDKTGALLMQKIWGGDSWEYPYDISRDAQGNLYKPSVRS
jgi:hypothetical protein